MVSDVLIVGIGDDGPASLSSSALAAVRTADLLCGGARHLSHFPGHPGEQLSIKGGLGPLVNRIRDARASGQRVVVLSSGDPGLFGIGALLGEQLGRDAIRVLPSVSSVALAFARLGEPWQDAVILSAHGRPLANILGPACAAARIAVLTDEVNTPAAVARALLGCGMEDARAAVGEHLGGERERVVRAPLSEIAAGAFAALNVLVVLREPAAVRWGRPLVGLPDTAFAHTRGMITKSEVRAVSVSRLALHDAHVLWDVGAGSGSVAIESASLLARGQVFAVERDPDQLVHLRANLRRFHAGNLQVIAGEAPRALGDLPDPDRVFIGGTGGKLIDILCLLRERLTPGGRIVVNLATLEHLSDTLAWLRVAGWPAEIAQVAVSRGAPVAGNTRLEALNPVFVVGAVRPLPAADGYGRGDGRAG